MKFNATYTPENNWNVNVFRELAAYASYLLGIPQMALQVERREPRDEITYVKNTKVTETVHEQVHNFGIVVVDAVTTAGSGVGGVMMCAKVLHPENHAREDIHGEPLHHTPDLHLEAA